MKKLLIVLFTFMLVASSAQGQWDSANSAQKMKRQYELSKELLLNNISRPDTLPGTIVASPSKDEPNYYYHWIRDAALVMDTIFELYLTTLNNPTENARYQKILNEFVEITKIHQTTPSLAGLGEVKFMADGTAFFGPWGRPQNDGPALRASAMTTMAFYLIQKGQIEYVRKHLYSGGIPAQGLIKKDLEYVSHNWQNKDFDLWEEVFGEHFFTRYSQMHALLKGAQLAEKMGDTGAAQWYFLQAKNVAASLNQFWDENKKHIVAHRYVSRSHLHYSKGGLDGSILLAVVNNFSTVYNKHFGVLDDRVVNTLFTLMAEFRHIYNINQQFEDYLPVIGRYPEDRYDGYRTDTEGNGWFITTHAAGQMAYQMSYSLLKTKPSITINSLNKNFYSLALGRELTNGLVIAPGSEDFNKLALNLVVIGDNFVERALRHVPNNGFMSEQINRHTGFMQGAPNLTWSHSSYINVYHRRAAVSGLIKNNSNKL